MAALEILATQFQTSEDSYVYFDGYSFRATPIGILDRIFSLEEVKASDSGEPPKDYKVLKEISTELCRRTFSPDNMSPEILGKEFWQSENGLSNRLISLTPDKGSGLILKGILIRQYNSQKMLEKLNEIGLINDSNQAWTLLGQLEEWKRQI